jgi:hypothetical protein
VAGKGGAVAVRTPELCRTVHEPSLPRTAVAGSPCRGARSGPVCVCGRSRSGGASAGGGRGCPTGPVEAGRRALAVRRGGRTKLAGAAARHRPGQRLLAGARELNAAVGGVGRGSGGGAGGSAARRMRWRHGAMESMHG